MRIGLLTTLNTNIGDDFIREGIVSTVNKIRSPHAVEFVPVNKHDPFSVYTKWQLRLKRATDCRPRTRTTRDWLRRNVKQLPWSRFDSCDLLIQCGTPVLWYGCRYSEWATPVWQDVLHRLSKVGKIVLNIGGGSTYPWENRPETLVGDEDEEFVRLMLETCRLTTARDPLTQKLFQSLGYETEVICCPALLAGNANTTTTAPSRKVVVNYMDGGGHYDWDQGIDKTQWQQTMAEVIRALLSQRWNVVLLAHDDKEYELALRIWPDLPCSKPESLKDYFEFMRDACFGVFNRMHASVAAAGLGIPSVAIGTDARNLMVGQTGLPVFYVKEATAERLLVETRRLEEQRESESSRLLELRENTQRRYEELLAPFVLP